MSDPVTSARARGQVWAIGHAVSYPYAGPCPAAHAPPHTPYRIRNSETQNPEPAGPEHGAVQNILSSSRTFPVDD